MECKTTLDYDNLENNLKKIKELIDKKYYYKDVLYNYRMVESVNLDIDKRYKYCESVNIINNNFLLKLFLKSVVKIDKVYNRDKDDTIVLYIQGKDTEIKLYYNIYKHRTYSYYKDVIESSFKDDKFLTISRYTAKSLVSRNVYSIVNKNVNIHKKKPIKMFKPKDLNEYQKVYNFLIECKNSLYKFQYECYDYHDVHVVVSKENETSTRIVFLKDFKNIVVNIPIINLKDEYIRIPIRCFLNAIHKCIEHSLTIDNLEYIKKYVGLSYITFNVNTKRKLSLKLYGTKPDVYLINDIKDIKEKDSVKKEEYIKEDNNCVYKLPVYKNKGLKEMPKVEGFKVIYSI